MIIIIKIVHEAAVSAFLVPAGLLPVSRFVTLRRAEPAVVLSMSSALPACLA